MELPRHKPSDIPSGVDGLENLVVVAVPSHGLLGEEEPSVQDDLECPAAGAHEIDDHIRILLLRCNALSRLRFDPSASTGLPMTILRARTTGDQVPRQSCSRRFVR